MSSEHSRNDGPEHRTSERSGTLSRRRFLATTTAVGLAGTVAGCSAVSNVIDPGPQTEQQAPTDTAKLQLDGAPDGLQKFKATIQATTSAVIADITPGVIDGEEFQIAAGGVGDSATTVRAVDLSGSVGSFSDQRPLVTVTFESAIPESDIDISTSQVTNDDGEAIPAERISLNGSGESPNVA